MGISNTLIAVGLMLIPVTAMAGVLERAEPLLPVFERVLDDHWPKAQMTHIMCGQIEQESSWKPRAELKTSREYGFGLGQITITSRFNNFEAAKMLKPLKDWQWEDRFNPKCQLIFLVFTNRSNFNRLHSLFDTTEDTWAASMVAYNAGLGTVLQRRVAASQDKKRRWFGGLDSVFLKYESRLLYGRNLGQLRNEYPVKVFKRSYKYIDRVRLRDQ